jgi:hypothetical protein
MGSAARARSRDGAGPGLVLAGGGKRARRRYRVDVSTRKLIIAALITGLAILVAFTIQITLMAR